MNRSESWPSSSRATLYSETSLDVCSIAWMPHSCYLNQLLTNSLLEPETHSFIPSFLLWTWRINIHKQMIIYWHNHESLFWSSKNCICMLCCDWLKVGCTRVKWPDHIDEILISRSLYDNFKLVFGEIQSSPHQLIHLPVKEHVHLWATRHRCHSMYTKNTEGFIVKLLSGGDLHLFPFRTLSGYTNSGKFHLALIASGTF